MFINEFQLTHSLKPSNKMLTEIKGNYQKVLYVKFKVLNI